MLKTAFYYSDMYFICRISGNDTYHLKGLFFYWKTNFGVWNNFVLTNQNIAV